MMQFKFQARFEHLSSLTKNLHHLLVKLISFCLLVTFTFKLLDTHLVCLSN